MTTMERGAEDPLNRGRSTSTGAVNPTRRTDAPGGSSVADKVVTLLLAFEQAPSASLAELARRTGVPKSTAHRLLASLRHGGLVEQVEHGHYRLGLRLWTLGQHARPHDGLVRVARPLLQDLANETGESAFLTVPEGTHSACIAVHESPNLMRLSMRVGELVPIHLGASNRILLAFTPPTERERIARHWASSEVEYRALSDDLRRIHQQGHVCTSSQLTPGTTAVAVPLLDAKGGLIAGLSIGGPSDRFDDARAQEHLDLLTRCARRIAQQVDSQRLATP